MADFRLNLSTKHLSVRRIRFYNVVALRPELLLVTACLSPVGQVVAQGKSSMEQAGDVLQVLIPATAYATTLYLDDAEGEKQFYQSFFTNLAVTYALKYAVNKPRQENNGKYSFPSGHTSAAFQGAAFIHRRYGLKYGLPAYLSATYVGWSRVEGESDKHDFTDVAAGMLIGTLSSYYFTTPYKDLVIRPELENQYIGFNVQYRW